MGEGYLVIFVCTPNFSLKSEEIDFLFRVLFQASISSRTQYKNEVQLFPLPSEEIRSTLGLRSLSGSTYILEEFISTNGTKLSELSPLGRLQISEHMSGSGVVFSFLQLLS